MERLSYRLLALSAALTMLLASCSLFVSGESPGASSGDSSSGLAGDGNAPVSFPDPTVGSKMEWVDGAILVYVPPGEFIMGGAGEDSPEHKVGMNGFWIYATEVTNAMYKYCLDTGNCSLPGGSPENLQDPELKDYPVVGVNWEQAQAYCEWVEGELPTEAQWEKTARGPEGNTYPWGDAAPSCDLLNFDNCVGDTSNVSANGGGISFYYALGMAGNVFEWTKDWYAADYYGNSPGADPSGPEQGTGRVVRGGGFQSGAEFVPSARRFFLPPGEYRPDLGFRCILKSINRQAAPFCSAPPRYPGDQPGDQPDRPGGNQPSCTPPDVRVVGAGCFNDSGFANIDLPSGVVGDYSFWSNGEEVDCQVVDGNRVTCTGRSLPADTTVTITVCSKPDGGSTGGEQGGGRTGGIVPVAAAATPQCETGYAYNPLTGQCEYAPGGGDPTGDNCPPGYVYYPNYGCLPGGGQQGDCPVGYFYDPQTQACIPGGGQDGCYYGFTAAGENCSTGCLPGYSYDQGAQCCTPDGEQPCPVGYTYSPYQEGCVPGDSSYPDCPQGYYYNPQTESCEPGTDNPCQPGTYYSAAGVCDPVPDDNECPDGYYFDVERKTCAPYPGGGQEPQCPDGYYYNPDRQTCQPVPDENDQPQCPEGYYYDPRQETCFPIPGGDQTPQCPAGYVYDTGLQTCVPVTGGSPTQCPEGFTYDTGQQTCVPDSGENPTCPEGYRYDPYLQTCVPGGGQPGGGTQTGGDDCCFSVTVYVAACPTPTPRPRPDRPSGGSTSCSSYTNSQACSSAGCNWVSNGQPPNYGVCR